MKDVASANNGGMGNITLYLKKITKYGDIAFASAIIGILVVLIFPIPTFLLDLLLSISITISVLILMTVLFINRSLDFNSFPTILLVSTILRLSLNIASTRLILSDGHNGTDAAGHVIEAFGGFVMQGSIVIGVIVFAILTIINFVVITKGSGRIAEVAARFSLDAMPGKQMAIDADLSAGLVDEETAKIRRKDLEDESTFYGAMDGANKFVRGDAIAGILITFINFIAGILIGVVQRDMVFQDALHTYTVLTIGDGLVSQIPALVTSTAAGLLVTKSGATGSAEKAIFAQIGRFPQAMVMASGLLLLMAAMPGIPAVIFVPVAALLGLLGWHLFQSQNQEKSKDKGAQPSSSQPMTRAGEAPKSGAKSQTEDESLVVAMQVDNLKLELGYALLPLVNYQKGHKLTDQIKALRKQMAKDLGFVMPSVRIQDNMQLPPNSYAIKVKEIECARGEIKPDMLMVMDPRGEEIGIHGEDTKEPAFGLPAKWIDESFREEALFRNYTVVDPPTVLTTHLTEVIKENISELLTYAETQKLLDDIIEDYKKLVTDIIPSQISVGAVQRILQNLLAENISIRDLPTILEAIAEVVRATQNITVITEHVRTRLARQISHSHTTPAGYVPIVSLSPKWEQIFIESLIGNGDEKQLSISPTDLQEFIAAIRKNFEEYAMQGEMPVLLTSPGIRPYVRSIIERFRPTTFVMSQNEIHSKSKIKTIGYI